MSLADETPAARYARFCRQRADAGGLRVLRPVGRAQGGWIERDGGRLRNFSSNDYLGLATHPALIAQAQAWTREWGCGSTASRLVCGDLDLFGQVESRVARGKKTATALVFNSGFQANAAILPALLDREILGATPLVFSDRLNHASIHHGCQAAGVRQIRYRHNDLNHLETLLNKHQASPGPRFILSESVFSMDGDQVDVTALVSLKNRFGAFLYLDEAHATGVLGPEGFGLSARVPGEVDLVMGTFSKGLGGFGAYVACDQGLREYLINRAGGFIYATALPPGVLGAMYAALELLPTLDLERERLLANAQRVRQVFQAAGIDTGASSTQIIPMLVGEAEKALEISRAFEAAGGLAVAIRPPTVPPGSSRMRFTLSALHDEEAIEFLLETIPQLWRKFS
ncbi:MAG: 8-amino-7-oxononanoate synthase [Magnetococcales bacterium]|nr:8-amino-7-oxononanoate synthase [Magnetococcales bacterium]